MSRIWWARKYDKVLTFWSGNYTQVERISQQPTEKFSKLQQMEGWVQNMYFRITSLVSNHETIESQPSSFRTLYKNNHSNSSSLLRTGEGIKTCHLFFLPSTTIIYHLLRLPFCPHPFIFEKQVCWCMLLIYAFSLHVSCS